MEAVPAGAIVMPRRHTEGSDHLPANGIQVQQRPALLRPTAGRSGRRNGEWMAEMNLILDSLGQIRIPLGELQQEGLKLLSIERCQQRIERWELLDFVAMGGGEER